MAKGTVTWFSGELGYGFIQAREKSYFVHYKEINSVGYKTLEKNQEVEFTPGISPRGPVAQSVTIHGSVVS